METAELKKKLIAKINLTEDNEILKNIMQILDVQMEDEVYILSDAQNDAIEEAREQYKNGQYSTHEEVQKEIKKWLKK
jgi:predicted transcriptional regulator